MSESNSGLQSGKQHNILWLSKEKTLIAILLLIYLLPLLQFSVVIPSMGGNPFARYIVTIGGYLALLGGLLWAIKSDRISRVALGLNRSKLRAALAILICGWIAYAALQLPALIRAGVDWAGSLGSPSLIFEQWLFVGITEEFLYRGYLLTRVLRCCESLPKPLATVLAVVLSSAVFATAHIPASLSRQAQGVSLQGIESLLSYVAFVFVAGLVYAYFFLRTRNIILVGLLHGGWNAPLVGQQNDLVRVVVFVIVVEVARLAAKRLL